MKFKPETEERLERQAIEFEQPQEDTLERMTAPAEAVAPSVSLMPEGEALDLDGVEGQINFLVHDAEGREYRATRSEDGKYRVRDLSSEDEREFTEEEFLDLFQIRLSAESRARAGQLSSLPPRPKLTKPTPKAEAKPTHQPSAPQGASPGFPVPNFRYLPGVLSRFRNIMNGWREQLRNPSPDDLMRILPAGERLDILRDRLAVDAETALAQSVNQARAIFSEIAEHPVTAEFAPRLAKAYNDGNAKRSDELVQAFINYAGSPKGKALNDKIQAFSELLANAEQNASEVLVRTNSAGRSPDAASRICQDLLNDLHGSAEMHLVDAVAQKSLGKRIEQLVDMIKSFVKSAMDALQQRTAATSPSL